MPGLFDGLSDAAAKLQDLGGKVVEGAKGLVESARPAVEEGLSAAKEKLSEGVESAKDFVENLTQPREADAPASADAPAAEKKASPMDALDSINAEAKEQMASIRAARTSTDDPIAAFMRAKEQVQTEGQAVVNKAVDAAVDTKAAVIENMEKAREHANQIAKDAGEALNSLKESVAGLGLGNVAQEAAEAFTAPVAEVVESAAAQAEEAADAVEEAVQDVADAAEDACEAVAVPVEEAACEACEAAEEAVLEAVDAVEDELGGAEILPDDE